MKNNQYNLSENSICYTVQADIYMDFSSAQDKPDRVWEVLAPLIAGKRVADIGCGNGKYACKAQGIAREVVAVDKSREQLSYIHNRAIRKVQADCATLPFGDNCFDIVFSSWMLGTIIEDDKRLLALNEMKRILCPGGRLILVENAPGSEFEILRGRDGIKDVRTHEYNKWLTTRGMKELHHINTFFEFSCMEQANEVFKTIWGSRLTCDIMAKTILHDIIIFHYHKD